jgi:competence ComEA-like helix-hairpin-helix protein
MVKRIADILALTTAERRVLLFLVVGCVLGLGIKVSRDVFASPSNFDYSASDSAFAAHSASLTNDADQKADHAGPVHVNGATKHQLMTLPGIGDVMAERMILDRQDNGPYTSVESLARVRGIGPKRVEQLRPLVIID